MLSSMVALRDPMMNKLAPPARSNHQSFLSREFKLFIFSTNEGMYATQTGIRIAYVCRPRARTGDARCNRGGKLSRVESTRKLRPKRRRG
jgi:hypothetical protein